MVRSTEHLEHPRSFDAAARLLAFLIRAAFFRNREPYISTWQESECRYAYSFWSAGEHLISYLKEIGVIKTENGYACLRLGEREIDRWAELLAENGLDVEKAFQTLIYHLSEDIISLSHPRFFVAYQPKPDALAQNDLPPISQMELDELAEDLRELGFLINNNDHYLPTASAKPAFRAASIIYDFSASD